MATPLYKKMKKGTSFYAFPNAIHDLNLVNMSDKYTMSFSKYVLLNIPEQVIEETGTERDQEKGVLNFDKDDKGPRFFNFQPGENSDLPVKFSDQLIESLRNYVSNYDTTMRESRINVNTDFYNVNEMTTPTEMIFWKWCKKLNLLDLEPAEHKIDWDKNLTDFNNTKGTNNTYFQKYLWKERDVNEYSCSVVENGTKTEITIEGVAKFKIGDTIRFTGDTSNIINGDVLGGTDYKLIDVTYTSNETTLIIDETSTGSIETSVVFLKYHRLIECVGDIQSVSQVQTSRHNFTDISIQIPPHAGATPTILFEIEDNTNYYPSLEMPILPQEQQVEILGSENTNSPIRLNPENYPGTFFGYFDTEDKTYKCSFGDRNRNSGDYFGIKITNNDGLEEEDYIEKLKDFNSDNIDGLKIDFKQEHYMKMNLPEYLIRNFDEFNSAYFDAPPRDYYFNAILWYYDLDDGAGNIVSNLFGIEFLNDPNDDDDDCDIDYNLITPYRKLVSNGDQDGYSYIFDLNLNVNVDNDVVPMSYDSTTIHNQFSFDLYQNILNSNAQIQESFLTIVKGYVDIQEELYELRSMVMSDTDIKKMSNRIDSLDELLKLYSTMQMVDSDTISIETEFNGTYPTLKMNAIQTLYENIIDVNITDVYQYNEANSGLSYMVPLSRKNMTRLNIFNENNDFNEKSKIVLNQDLEYKQSLEIYIQANMSEIVTDLDIYINYENDGTVSEELIIGDITLPIDLEHYDALDVENSIYTNNYYNNINIENYSNIILSGDNSSQAVQTMEITLEHNYFKKDDYIYIDNLYFNNGTTKIDYSGVFKIIDMIDNTDTQIIIVEFDMTGLTPFTTVKISYYKGWKINILRVGQSDNQLITDRYKITKELL